MAAYVIKIEGQEIPVPEEIGASDENVKKALAPFFPDAANAMITRTEKDGVVGVNVVKRAGTKGSADNTGGDCPQQVLIDCAESLNPAIRMYQEVFGADPEALLEAEKLLEMESRIEKAIEQGEAQQEMIGKTIKRLALARPMPAPGLTVGF